MNNTNTKLSSDIQTKLSVTLPDGRILVATDKGSESHPGIQIALVTDDTVTRIAWVEYNSIRPDYTLDERLRFILWNDTEPNEPAVNMSYDTGSFEVEDKNGLRTVEKETLPI